MRDNTIRFGWLPNLTLGEFVRDRADIFAQLPFVLVSSVDSETRVGGMPWAREQARADPNWALSVFPLVISGPDLVQAVHDRNIFSGFDEVWIPSDLPTKSPPDGVSLVAPSQFDESLPSDVETWMRSTGVRLALGDGDGLNFAATDLDLARSLGLLP